MEKMSPFKKRSNKTIEINAFSKKSFINEFTSIVMNENLNTDQKTLLLYNHCLYDKNSPLNMK